MSQIEKFFKEFDEMLANKEELIDLLEKKIEEELGMVPFIIKEVEKRPELLSVYSTTRPKSLDAKTAELVTLASAVANKSE